MNKKYLIYSFLFLASISLHSCADHHEHFDSNEEYASECQACEENVGIQTSKTKPSNVDLKVLDYKKTIALVILMILYGLTILRIGYFLSTSIFLVLSYIVLGERKWIWIFILSFPFVAIFMYLLHGLLNIYLRDPFLQYIGVMG